MTSPQPRSPTMIRVRGARTHNLKSLSVDLPRNRFIVITGPSGSGKSSLAFDTIFAEGQRRFVESLSVYARQFIDQLAKPDVESIDGLSPTISIEQKTSSTNPRSTVGTVTEVYDYLRVLYARASQPHCYQCGQLIVSQTPEHIIEALRAIPSDSRMILMAPVVQGRKGEYQKELAGLRAQGFVRARVDGEFRDLDEAIRLEKGKKHSIEVVVDRLVVKPKSDDYDSRLAESVTLGLRLGSGQLFVEYTPPGKSKIDVLYSQNFACRNCGISYPEPEPRLFSFNSPMGACSDCDGLGYLGLPDPEDSENDVTGSTSEAEESDDAAALAEILDHQDVPCPSCGGARLRKEAQHYRFYGAGITELCAKSLSELSVFFKNVKLSARDEKVVGRLIKEIRDRLTFLERVGVDYMSLDRRTGTLSGGEAQRIRLASQIGSSLVGIIYVLDEPSIGLHARDHARLLDSLARLRDLGNTIVVVEHDRETMERADFIVDLGPGAGSQGGVVTGTGTPKELTKNPASLTGRYLSGKMDIAIPEKRRAPDTTRMISLVGARKNNLKNVDLDIPLGLFICVTGVSGSGKSSLILDTLYPAMLSHALRRPAKDQETLRTRLGFESVRGLEHIDKVLFVDQSPIGRTPRSNPATYTGLFSRIRELFSILPEAQIRGFKPGRFSFNVKGGRCEVCEGGGQTRIAMHFLPDVYVTCTACNGKRYNDETLRVLFKGRNVAEILALTAADALTLFEAQPGIAQKLRTLNDVGLGYLTLGQSALTLSGGESQRLKLARELSKRPSGRTVYLLDEPSTGLHFDDIAKLLAIIQKLVDQGNTVIVIEHNLDIIKVADHVIDLGPDAGSAGGQIIAKGTPEDLARNIKRTASHTGAFLKKELSI